MVKSKKILCVILSVVMIVCVLPFSVLGAEIVETGKCGEKVTYTLDDEGVLTFSGEGDMQGEMPFGNREDIKSVIIKYGITSIGDHAFNFCRNLKSVTIPNSVIRIGKSAFEDTCLKAVTIPNSVTSIGEFAFTGTELVSVTIPSSVNEISDGVFTFCVCLESISVDKNNKVYHSANNCIIETASKTVIAACNSSVIPNDGSVTKIGSYAFQGCTRFTSIIIPDGVTSIGDRAFSACYKLGYIAIPDGVTSIGDDAFSACTGLTSVIIPKSVDSIGQGAFSSSYCGNLKDVFFTGTETEWKQISIGIFNDALLDATIHYNFVPCREHDYTSTTSATCKKDGATVYNCSKCGFTYSIFLWAWEVEHIDNDGDGICDECGGSLPKEQNFFDKIISFIRDFFNSILKLFSNLFG